MNKTEQDIKLLYKAFEPFKKRWDKLSPAIKVDALGLVLEASRLTVNWGMEIIQEDDKKIADLQEKIEEMDDIMASYEAFILEKGLSDEYIRYLNEALAEFASAGKPVN